MSHKAIRTLIEETAKSLQDDIQYSYGTQADFDLNIKKALTLINTSLLTASPSYTVNGVSNFMKLWRIQMAFCYQPVQQYGSTDYEKHLDDMDGLVDSFINRLNFFTPMSGTFVIQSINQEPFVGLFSALLTGYILTFNMLVSDDFQYCIDC